MSDEQTSAFIQYKWEVAISLLSEDEPFALKLRTQLAKHVRGEIFLYSRKQEAVAEAGELVTLFRRVFRSQARCAVIVHRERWGKTPYTALEQDAIRARYLHDGPRQILVISMDGTYPESWYPEDHFRLSPEQFSIAQIAAIIVGRVEETGGMIGRESPTAMALRLENERFKRTRLNHEIESVGPETMVAMANDCFSALRDLCESISKHSTEAMDFDKLESTCRLNYRWASLVVQWHRPYSNSMKESQLAMSILSGPTHFAGRRGTEPDVLLRATFDLDHPEDDMWGWKPRGAGHGLSAHFSTQELADWAVSALLDMTSGDKPPRRAERLGSSESWATSWQ